jgi:hypothetical protein
MDFQYDKVESENCKVNPVIGLFRAGALIAGGTPAVPVSCWCGLLRVQANSRRLAPGCEVSNPGMSFVVLFRGFNPHAPESAIASFVLRRVVKRILVTQFLSHFGVSAL